MRKRWSYYYSSAPRCILYGATVCGISLGYAEKLSLSGQNMCLTHHPSYVRCVCEGRHWSLASEVSCSHEKVLSEKCGFFFICCHQMREINRKLGLRLELNVGILVLSSGQNDLKSCHGLSRVTHRTARTLSGSAAGAEGGGSRGPVDPTTFAGVSAAPPGRRGGAEPLDDSCANAIGRQPRDLGRTSFPLFL